ncbi:MAG: outer membrane protein assembly factor BamE [Alphaproteobacteria bacterium]
MTHFVRRSISLSLLLASLLVGCTPIVENHGYNTAQADFSQIVVGQSRKDDVQALLGSPSAASHFGDSVWYYIFTREHIFGPQAPEIVKQNVVGVRFDATDTVSEIIRYTAKDGKPVELVEKTTPAEGRTLGVMEQLLGNFGRFNTPGRGINPTGSPGRI